VPRIGRILIARGRDAADVAIATTFGQNTLESFKVWTDESQVAYRGRIASRTSSSLQLHFDGLHVHSNFKRVSAAAEDQAAQRTHISVVSAPGERNVTICRHKIVRGIHV